MTRVDKTRGELLAVIGPYEPDVITYDGVYQSFLEEKRIWGKDSGRMYAHNIISWHEDEPITPEQSLEFGKEFAQQWFAGFQSLVGVHIDRNHVHCHIITNSVSFMDGHKLHNTKKDLQRMKDFTNQMCVERGLSVAQKGRNFHGNELEQGTVRAWSKDKYHLMQNESKNSFVADCGVACLDALEASCSREEFIRQMAERGWSVIWKDSRKHITFQNVEGKKVRDSNLSKTFHLDISKEALINEFERKTAVREETARYERELADRREQENAELERYYREVQDAAGEAVRDDSYTERYHQRAGEDHPSADVGYREAGKENIGAAKQLGAGQNQSERTARERTIREGFANLTGTESGTGMEEESRKSRAGYGPDGTELFLADIQSQVRDSESQRQNRETERCRRSAAGERKVKEAESVQSVVQRLTDQKAKRLTEDNRRHWQVWYQAKKTAMKGYVGMLTLMCFATMVLSIIRQKAFCKDVIDFFQGFGKTIQWIVFRIHVAILSMAEITENVPNDVAVVMLKWGMVVLIWGMLGALIGFGIYKFWEKYGEDIRGGIDVWNCSVAVLVLAGLVYFGDYVKEIVSVNLFGMWLLADVLLILAGWYVWGCKKYRGLC